jgi:hypothetical protein
MIRSFWRIPAESPEKKGHASSNIAPTIEAAAYPGIMGRASNVPMFPSPSVEFPSCGVRRTLTSLLLKRDRVEYEMGWSWKVGKLLGIDL